MPELESMIENKLIEQLVYGDSQWTYRDDLKTEEDLWNNFRYILEQNNKDRLDGESLSDAEFEQVKNQLQFSSFYKAGEWLVGENGKVQVHVQRDTQRLHLVIMNHEHIAGGSSVYEVINQYSALSIDDDKNAPARDRRFDVTLMINGLPMIHIELKNKQHSYMDGFWQIKKYIGEGKYTGIFSAVQMFVISNGVNTKYFSAASDTELNPKFISGWLDKKNNPVPDYLDFAKNVLRIPEAHEMIARYTVLDEDAKRLILLRPYQIHAIEAIRDASKTGKSGFVWHTTGSGKTLTSYKATRNLLMDIPAIDKAIFLIDRKDLDTQTTMAFQAYANNDLIDVDETENINDLKKKLKSDDRQVIVTTIQKLHLLISKRLKEGTPEYNKIRNLKIAYVVDECHRAVTPSTKRELERFFGNSLWFGFTGTPRFKENPYPQLGDLPRTTETLYGECLHKYTIQNAIHDNAVLGFQVEHNGPKNIEDETDSSAYNNEVHMLKVLDVIINKSYHKLGFQNGKGLTYEGFLTTNSIGQAQKYYELLTRVKNGETSLQIDDRIKQVLPDFPKFAITYSVTENEEGSQVNQQKMQCSLDDYNKMFGTKYEMSQIQGYNGNLNKRLARKDTKYKSRSEQLDLVIVVDRLLTGFDAPCLSTIFIDRQPMGPHDLIQAFSRTNRIFDKNKAYGQIVTFQAPVLFKKCVDDAVKLYSAGGTGIAILAEWNEIEPAFKKSLSALRVSAPVPSDIAAMSLKEKEVFAKMFQNFDKLFAQLKSFTNYEDGMLEEYGITEKEYEDYAGHYENVMEEINENKPDKPDDPDTPDVDLDYELMAYSHTKIDYEYIINLIQNIVTPDEDGEEVSPEERQKKLEEVKQYVEELRKENPKVAEIMSNLINEIELDENKYKGQSILNIV
ncbi:MAG: type I restriction endonuclease subunit R, partial [Suipraeoptans sp.]